LLLTETRLVRLYEKLAIAPNYAVAEAAASVTIRGLTTIEKILRTAA
jgi:hypothetical protein